MVDGRLKMCYNKSKIIRVVLFFMKKEVKITGAVAGAVALAGVAAVGAVAELVFRTGIARRQPRLTYNKAKKVDALQQQRLEAQQQLEQMPHEKVYITSRDGLRLNGHWLPAENARRTVILVHGWRSTWARDFGMHMPFLRDCGCNLLFIEQRSHGTSEGKYIGFGVLERYDCLRWLDFLRSRTGDQLPVYLFGISMGAATVLMTTGFRLPSCVKGVIADCGFTSPEEILTHVLQKERQDYPRQFNRLIGAMALRRAGYGPRDYSTLDAMAVNKRPVLFIHGGADDFVPLSMTVRNYEACRAQKSILVVDGAPHAKSYLVAPELYQQTVTEFFRRCELTKREDTNER